MNVNKEGKAYVIPMDDTESHEVYAKRVEFIQNKINLLSGECSIDELIRRSRIWRNINYYSMKYPSVVRKIL